MSNIGYSVIQKYGARWTGELMDDGSLDTVVLVQDYRRKFDAEEIRFSDTSDLRQPDGNFTSKGWRILAEMAVDDYSDVH